MTLVVQNSLIADIFQVLFKLDGQLWVTGQIIDKFLEVYAASTEALFDSAVCRVFVRLSWDEGWTAIA